MQRIRALIVDDEPYARERVRRLIGDDPDIEVVGECPDGFRAVDQIRALAPDLVFLDVVMPGKDGFEVLDELGAPAPAVIFLTAFDRFAVRAFDACALDYLLKPFDEERFARAVARAKQALARAADDEGTSVARPLRTMAGPLLRLVVRSNGRIRFVKTADVSWIGAEGNYACVHAGAESYLVREALSALEAQLDPQRFVRIHRATIVNLDRVRELEPLFNGQHAVLLDDGTCVTMSRRYRAHVERVLGRPLGG
ncbi:MAG TPA: LytTR family DNA-binding domain-containing protein [Kofleriaceae bacterium]|nr:LytTR family DNA-binding domain-containing protein [Kofleriaceae bacterium]